MFDAYDFVGARTLSSQAIVEPHENGADLWIEVAQALDKLNGEGAIQGLFFELPKNRGRRNKRLPTGAEQPVG